MNFYQKILVFTTLAIIGLTITVIVVCFNTPYSDVFITECVAIIWAIILVGISLVRQVKKHDSVLPYSFASIWISLLYFLFALLMVITAYSEIKISYFILLHIGGVVASVVLFAVFSLGEHNIKMQDFTDKLRLATKKDFYFCMGGIVDEFCYRFPAEEELLLNSKKMLDNLRFASDTRLGMEEVDCEIKKTLECMKEAVLATNIDDYRENLNVLIRLYRLRESKAKLM